MFEASKSFLRLARRTKGYGLLLGLHGYVYLRWPYRYIRAALFLMQPPRGWQGVADLLGRLLRGGRRTAGTSKPPAFSDGYHAKVLPLSGATRLIQVNRPISLTLPEKVIPYPLARDLVLQSPLSLAVLDCPCRSAREDPCLPLGVCLIVGEPFASFVVERHPARARSITAGEAVAIMEAEQARGHVQHAFFKDALFGRFYCICNCCSCCCVAMQAQRAGGETLAPSGFTARLYEALCQGCGACEGWCPFGALRLDEGRCLIDEARCMGCGVCVAKCPQAALRLEKDPSKGEPLEL